MWIPMQVRKNARARTNLETGRRATRAARPRRYPCRGTSVRRPPPPARGIPAWPGLLDEVVGDPPLDVAHEALVYEPSLNVAQFAPGRGVDDPQVRGAYRVT